MSFFSLSQCQWDSWTQTHSLRVTKPVFDHCATATNQPPFNAQSFFLNIRLEGWKHSSLFTLRVKTETARLSLGESHLKSFEFKQKTSRLSFNLGNRIHNLSHSRPQFIFKASNLNKLFGGKIFYHPVACIIKLLRSS